MPELPKLYTRDEVAALLRVDRATVDRERRRGRLGCLLVGRKVFVTADQLAAYLQLGSQEVYDQETL